MHLSSTEVANSGHRSRNWLIEALVVLGVLGFGYFAVAVDRGPVANITTDQATR